MIFCSDDKKKKPNSYHKEEDDWISNVYGSFKVFNEYCTDGCTFDDAVEICNKTNAGLPVIHNKEENKEIQVKILLNKKTKIDFLWFQSILFDNVSWLSIHSK